MAGRYERTAAHRDKMSKINLGRKRTPETRARISAAYRPHPHTDESRAKISAANTGKRRTPEMIQAMSDRQKGKRDSVATRAKKSSSHKAMIARDPALRSRLIELGLKANHGARLIEYLDAHGRLNYFRSSWEREYAKALDKANLTWFYEPVRILLSDGRTYVPDFYVEEWKQYVEIKGHRSTDKVELAIADGHSVTLVQGKHQLAEALATMEA